jgi:hypothetical protein
MDITEDLVREFISELLEARPNTIDYNGEEHQDIAPDEGYFDQAPDAPDTSVDFGFFLNGKEMSRHKGSEAADNAANTHMVNLVKQHGKSYYDAAEGVDVKRIGK